MERRYIKTSLHQKSVHHPKCLVRFHCRIQFMGFIWNHTFPRRKSSRCITIPYLSFQSRLYGVHPDNLHRLYMCTCMLWASQKVPNELCAIGCFYFQCQLHSGIYNPSFRAIYSCRSCMPHCCHGHGHYCLCCHNKNRFHGIRTITLYFLFRIHYSRHFWCNIRVHVSSALLLLRCCAF